MRICTVGPHFWGGSTDSSNEGGTKQNQRPTGFYRPRLAGGINHLGPLGHWGPLFKITNDEIFPIFNNCVVQKYRFECQIYSIFGTQKRFWGNYIRTMCYVFHNNSQRSVLSFYVSTHKFSIELIFGSSRTNMVGMSSSCMPHTFSVDSECVMFYHNKSQCLVFSFYVSTHKMFDRSYLLVQLEPK